MDVISSWRAGDPPPARLTVAREFLVVWSVHLSRTVRHLRSTR